MSGSAGYGSGGGSPVTFPITVSQGGTGQVSLTNHGILIGEGLNPINSIPLTNGQLLIGSTGIDPVAATLTPGTGISIVSAPGSITISNTEMAALAYTPVASTPYVVLTTDDYISVDSSALSITIKLPNAATSGRYYVIKDRLGFAATRNITITTVGGIVLIDGAATFQMNSNYQSVQVMGNGASYEIF